MAFKVFGKLPEGQRLQRIIKSENYKYGSFQNLAQTIMEFTPATAYDTFKQRANNIDKAPKKPIPTIKTDLSALESDVPTVVWFGHSSYLVKVNGLTILVDPVFSNYASPIPGFVGSYAHTHKYGLADMPAVIDVLLITHDHYDHLDYSTVASLKSKVKHVVTGLGVGAHLEHWGFNPDIIHELDWWQEAKLPNGLKFTAAPGRHFSGRTLKRNQSIWSGFALDTGNHKLYLGGDSGYGTHFKKIGEHFGGFDLAILECGQYNVNWHAIHMMPEETVQASLDLKSKMLLPVHWAKFTLSVHPWYESVTRALAAADTLSATIATPQIGQPLVISQQPKNTIWWEY
jgi:L-ascorbate metabolism protein UlaG (beta-lactamase superfamily)